MWELGVHGSVKKRESSCCEECSERVLASAVAVMFGAPAPSSRDAAKAHRRPRAHRAGDTACAGHDHGAGRSASSIRGCACSMRSTTPRRCARFRKPRGSIPSGDGALGTGDRARSQPQRADDAGKRSAGLRRDPAARASSVARRPASRHSSRRCRCDTPPTAKAIAPRSIAPTPERCRRPPTVLQTIRTSRHCTRMRR